MLTSSVLGFSASRLQDVLTEDSYAMKGATPMFLIAPTLRCQGASCLGEFVALEPVCRADNCGG